MQQLQGNKEYGNKKKGYLLKQSHGIWKVWQRRKCAVEDGVLTISHARSNREPTRIELATCQVKPNARDKTSFDLISWDRTYHFRAREEHDCAEWMAVLTSSQEEALTMVFQREQSPEDKMLEDLTHTILEDIRRLPGNGVCCDCGSSDPTWLSTNLGVLVCLECSGIHRQMGHRVSRIRSCELDMLGTAQLLLLKNVGNKGLNNIFEANLPVPSPKPTPSSDMTVREHFIKEKYLQHQYSRRTCSAPCGKLSELLEAVQSRDLPALIQLYVEGVELTEPLPERGQELGETALHMAIRMADQTSLPLVDFLIQNCGNLGTPTGLGNTACHYCCLYGKPECLKLLLRLQPSVDAVNHTGETALDIARRLKHSQCEDLLSQVISGTFNHHVHIKYGWNLPKEDVNDSNCVIDDKENPNAEERPETRRSSSISPLEELSHPGFGAASKQLLDDITTNPVLIFARTDSSTSPTSDEPPLPPGNAGHDVDVPSCTALPVLEGQSEESRTGSAKHVLGSEDLSESPQEDLPPEAPMEDLPPNIEADDTIETISTGDVSPRAHPPCEVVLESLPVDISSHIEDNFNKEACGDSNDMTPTVLETSITLPSDMDTGEGEMKTSEFQEGDNEKLVIREAVVTEVTGEEAQEW